MCLYSRIQPNKKYQKNNKNKGQVPLFYDPRVLSVAIGCGNCIECKKQKAREWQVRLMEDIKQYKNGKFITLTFSNESIKTINKEIPNTYIDKNGDEQELIGYKRDNAIAKYAVRHWLERWRKRTGKSVRHWLITELGHKGTENIHLHGIIYTDDLLQIRPSWKYGYVWDGYRKNGKIINYVSNRTINYVIKYVMKMDVQHKYYKPRILSTPGIGAIYTNSANAQKNKFNWENTIETYKTQTGHKIAMPKYWRNKIYTEAEREQLWLQQLDKNTRWIRGEKIDVKNGLDEYYKTLKWHQERNKELGYGNDTKNWKREEYEKQRRIAMLNARTNTNAFRGTGEDSPDPPHRDGLMAYANRSHEPRQSAAINQNEVNKIWKQINKNVNKINKEKFG